MALIEDFCKKFTQIHEMLPYIRQGTQFTHASKFKSRRKVTLKCFTTNLNNRAWIIERESPESGILNVECKYWTLLLWKSFVEALNESNFCCFVLFQTIIIIVNRAGNRAMLANFTSTVVILLSCFLRQSIVGLKLFGTFVKSCAIINSGVFTLVWSLNKADPTLISYLRNDRAVCAPFQF